MDCAGREGHQTKKQKSQAPFLNPRITFSAVCFCHVQIIVLGVGSEISEEGDWFSCSESQEG